MNIDRMATILPEKPGHFEMGRQFKTAALKTMISGIREDVQRLKN